QMLQRRVMLRIGSSGQCLGAQGSCVALHGGHPLVDQAYESLHSAINGGHALGAASRRRYGSMQKAQRGDLCPRHLPLSFQLVQHSQESSNVALGSNMVTQLLAYAEQSNDGST